MIAGASWKQALKSDQGRTKILEFELTRSSDCRRVECSYLSLTAPRVNEPNYINLSRIIRNLTSSASASAPKC
jgi:hypothetical protein